MTIIMIMMMMVIMMMVMMVIMMMAYNTMVMVAMEMTTAVFKIKMAFKQRSTD